MANHRTFAVLLTLAALAAPIAACGEDDAANQVDQARESISDKANELEGSLDDLSKDDLREALADVEDAAKNGSAESKQKARELERKIERELDQRN